MSTDQVTVDLSAWARKWKNRREGLVMRAAITEIERLRKERNGLLLELDSGRLFVRHTDSCESHGGGDCDCGKERWVTRVRGLLAGDSAAETGT